jgi:hypothetical protein
LAIADEAFENAENVDPGQQANQVQDDYALFEEFSNAEKDTQLNNKDVELKETQTKLLSVTEELGKMKDCVRRINLNNEKERRRRKYYEIHSMNGNCVAILQ